MGLDSYWVDAEGKSGQIEGNFKVCGGMLSGHGNDSFRGKVYDAVVQQVTGVSLYQEEISADTVKVMASRLLDLDGHKQDSLAKTYGMALDEFVDLIRMFRLHAEAGHSLKGWW